MEIRELEFIEIGDGGDLENRDIREKPVSRKEKHAGAREKQYKKKRQRRRRFVRTLAMMVSSTAVVVLLFIVIKLADSLIVGNNKGVVETTVEIIEGDANRWKNHKWGEFYSVPLEHPPMDVQLLTVNEYSRPGQALPEVKNIFVHYTANAGTTAIQNRSYFESLAETHERSASAHFVIGYEGEIVQCIPTKEIAYAVKQRNYDSISIECCYLNENGVFTQETYATLIELTAWLLHKYELAPEDVLRHYDEGGKNCPKYYVENEKEWQIFLNDLTAYMENISQSS